MSTQSTITANLAVTREKRSHLSFPLLENIMWHADFLERKYDICTVAIVEIFKLDVSLIIIESPTCLQTSDFCKMNQCFFSIQYYIAFNAFWLAFIGISFSNILFSVLIILFCLYLKKIPTILICSLYMDVHKLPKVQG